MRHRPGITLVEVLIAIFVMGVGMLALLVLFPVGALSIARAIKDDRCATAAANSTALAAAFQLQTDAKVNAELDKTPGGYTAPQPDTPSYPVYVDPFYAEIGSATLGAGGGSPGLFRSSVDYGGSGLNAAAKYFTLLDDLELDNSGMPTNGTVSREGRYTWAYLVRRPTFSDNSILELTVVVYSDRSTQVAQGETAYSATGSKGGSSINVTWASGTPKPALRNGAWLLDVTYEELTAGANKYGSVHGHFYRVINAVETGDTSVTVDVQPALRGTVNRIVVMENVAEVFERGTRWVR